MEYFLGMLQLQISQGSRIILLEKIRQLSVLFREVVILPLAIMPACSYGQDRKILVLDGEQVLITNQGLPILILELKQATGILGATI
jgi:hypothetical protein